MVPLRKEKPVAAAVGPHSHTLLFFSFFSFDVTCQPATMPSQWFIMQMQSLTHHASAMPTYPFPTTITHHLNKTFSLFFHSSPLNPSIPKYYLRRIQILKKINLTYFITSIDKRYKIEHLSLHQKL